MVTPWKGSKAKLIEGKDMVLLWQPVCVVFVLSPLPAYSLCVCLWVWRQQQQSGTPERDQLITHWLYLLGLSTTWGLVIPSTLPSSTVC